MNGDTTWESFSARNDATRLREGGCFERVTLAAQATVVSVGSTPTAHFAENLDGCPGMRRSGQWLKEQGAILLDAIEDPQSGHGALQLNPRNSARLLELFGR